MRKYLNLKTLQLMTAAAGFGLISGCSILSPVDLPQVKQYQILSPNLQVNQANTAQKAGIRTSNKPFDLTLFATPLTADSPYNSTQMYYREHNFELSSYTQNAWAAEPQQMLGKNLLQALQHYRSFKSVVSSNFIGYADYRLTGNLNQLTQIIEGNNSRVILSVTYTLTDANSGQAVSVKTFALEQETSADAQGFAQAANKLAEQLAKTLNDWLLSQPLSSQHNNPLKKG